MRGTPLAPLIVAVALVAGCTGATAVPPPTARPTVPLDRTAGVTPTPRITAKIGGCTSPAYTSRQLLDRYFSLTATGDTAAVIDCFAKRYRDQGDIQFSAERWASAGRLASLSIRYVDNVKGCDRYAAQFQFVVPDPGRPEGFYVFYSVGPEAGTMRIFDGATGLPTAENTLVSCA